MASDTDAPTGILELAEWDARVTSDGKVSAVDVIACIRQVSHTYAWETYNRPVEEERVPRCEMRALPPRCVSVNLQTSAKSGCLKVGRRGGRGAME